MKTILRYKPAANGYETIYLDTCYQGRRKYKMLGLKVKRVPQTPEDRRRRKELENLAREIANKIDTDLLKGKLRMEEKKDLNVDFIKFSNEWIRNSEGIIDIRIYRAAISKLKLFSGESLYCYEIDEGFLERFYRYLHRSLTGVTPHNYMKKLKIIIKAAKKSNHFYEDPTENLKLKKGKSAEKDYLTFEEINLLHRTTCSNELVKRAALFACNTGLRFCDIVRLNWGNINDRTMNIIQAKTKVPVTIILNENALALAGKRKENHELVFPLCSHTAVLKSIRKWVKDAGINKKITFHCFRVSFATNLMNTGCDVAIASKLLGHTSLLNTDTYIRISEMLKQTATEKFPSFINN